MMNKAAVIARGPAREISSPVSTVVRKPRRRGRPSSANAENVREKLLTAAQDLFLRYGYRAVSSRQIGAAAGVNFAMIRYYFGGKPGLYREILNSALLPTRAMLDSLADTRAPVALSQILAAMARTWAANPWIAGFVIREVLTPDGPMRDMFFREFPERLAPLVQRIVESEIESGGLRADIDPKLLCLSMASLSIFPFLTFPITSRMLDVSNTEEFVERLLRHSSELLIRGVSNDRLGISSSNSGATAARAESDATPVSELIAADGASKVTASTR